MANFEVFRWNFSLSTNPEIGMSDPPASSAIPAADDLAQLFTGYSHCEMTG